jgi:hypothetical protein
LFLKDYKKHRFGKSSMMLSILLKPFLNEIQVELVVRLQMTADIHEMGQTAIWMVSTLRLIDETDIQIL